MRMSAAPVDRSAKCGYVLLVGTPTRILAASAAAILAFAALAAVLVQPAAAQETPAAAPAPAVPTVRNEALERVLAIEKQLVTVLDAVCQSSVSIRTAKLPPAEPGKPAPTEPVPSGAGSGVLVQRAGKSWVVTNDHVIDKADRIDVVTCDGVAHRMEVADVVQQYDIALLRFADKAPKLRAVPVKPLASQALSTGQWVLATGNPFSLADDGVPVATLGVISGLGRTLGDRWLYGSAIQHDAAVNPGNSGGPLWDLDGDLVGINGMIAMQQMTEGSSPSNSGAAFAIPIHQVENFLGQMVDERKKAQAGWLGVVFETWVDRSGKAAGAKVMRVDPNGPAHSSRGTALSLEIGDIVDSFTVGDRKTPIRTASDLTNELVCCPAGTLLKLRLRRGTRTLTWSGKLDALRK